MRRVAAVALLAAGCAGGDGAGEAAEGTGSDDATLDGPGAAVLVRPDDPGAGLQFDFEEGEVVESYPSPGGRFRVHFTRDGINAVPAADDDASGVPDFVEEVGAIYDEVLEAYQALGFRAPLGDGDVTDDGGDDRFDVYLVDFAGVGDGAYRDDGCLPDAPDRCAGYMTQENDYAGYGYPSTTAANRILASHELFHAIQSAYDNGQGSVFAEGTAVWATEVFDPSLRDFEWFLDGFLENPDRPIDEPLPGPVDPFSYGSAIVFRFLEERFGADVVLALFDAVEDGAGGVDDPYWVDRLDPLLAAEGSSFADAFTDFARWNLYTDDFANPDEAYAQGEDYPRVRIDDGAMPYQEDRLRLYRASAQYVGMSPGNRDAVTAAVVPTELAPDGADDVRLLLAVESGDAITELVALDDPTAGATTVDASAADRVVVVVVNTTTTGDSRKPGLCVGTIDEVAACKVAVGAIEPAGAGGAGGGGDGATATTGAGGSPGAGGSSAGGGAADGDDLETDTADDGCGCAVPGTVHRGTGGALAAVALVVASYARRRRARAASPRPSTTA